MELRKISRTNTFGIELSRKILNDIYRVQKENPKDKKIVYDAANEILKLPREALLDYEYNSKTKRNDWTLKEPYLGTKKLPFSFADKLDVLEIQEISARLQINELTKVYNELYAQAYPVRSFLKNLNPFANRDEF